MKFFETLGAVDGIILVTLLIALVVISIMIDRRVSDAEKIGTAKSFSIPIIIGATVATHMGAATGVGNMELCYQGGFTGFTVILMWNLGWLLLCTMSRRLRASGANTLTEFIAMKFGRSTQKVSSIIALVYIISETAAQFMACGTVFSMLGLGSMKNGIIILGGIIILMTLFGGLKGVAITDTIQSVFIVTICVAVIPAIAFYRAGGLENMFSYWAAADPGRLGFFSGLSPSLLINYMLSYALCCGAEPTLAAKFLAAKDTKSGVIGTVSSLVICSLLPISMCLAVMCTPLVMPDITMGSVFFPEMISRFLPVVIRGLAMFTFISLFLTTGDSFLQLAAILITNDYIKPHMPQGSEKKLVFMNRMLIVVIGVSAILIGIWGDTIVQVMMLGAGCYGAGMFFPLMLGCFSKRHFSAVSVNIAMLVGCAATLAWNIVLPENFSAIPGVAVGAAMCLVICFAGSSAKSLEFTGQAAPALARQNVPGSSI